MHADREKSTMKTGMVKTVKIRTGGQSGVDRAAMDFARECGLELCGWCPKGGWAEDYPEPPGLLRDYPELQETPSEGTEQRTRWNMRDADAILTIIPESSSESEGTNVGLAEGESLGKPMYTATSLEDVREQYLSANSFSGSALGSILKIRRKRSVGHGSFPWSLW